MWKSLAMVAAVLTLLVAVPRIWGSGVQAFSPACPIGWTCGDIGNPAPAGVVSKRGSPWIIAGGGPGVGTISDNFTFVWQRIAGNSDTRVHVLAQTGSDSAAAGVMYRENASAGAAFYAVRLTPAHSLRVAYRAARGTASQASTLAVGSGTSYLKALRSGNRFMAYTSQDGVSWIHQSGADAIVTMNTTALGGVAVSSHARGTGNTATVDTFYNYLLTNRTSGLAPPPSGRARSSCAGQIGPYMTAVGTGFCAGGQVVQLYGSTMYPYWSYNGHVYRGSGWELPAFTQYIDQVLTMAQAAHLNIIRPTDYLASATSWSDPVVWTNMDYLVRQAQARHMWVILDISTFRQWLAAHGASSVYDASLWTPFLQFVAQRYVTATAVGQYSIAGEIPPPNRGGVTASQYIQFFTSVEDQLYADDGGHHLISLGGLSFLNNPSYGIPWQTLYALPHNAVVAIHIYSQGDRDVTVPMVSAWAQAHQKPFLVEEFGFKQSTGDQARAAAYADIDAWSRAHGAQGLVFWNLGTELAPTSYDVSTGTPLTWAVVQQYAPVSQAGTSTATSTVTQVPPTATRTSTPGAPTNTTTPVPPTSTSTNTPVPPTATSVSVSPTATPAGCPSGWNCADIGTPPLVGSQVLSGATWTIAGEGTDIGGTADQFHFVWQALPADGGFRAHVLTQTNTNARARAGVMLRGGSDPSAPFYALVVTPQRGIFVLDRSTQGGGVSTVASLAGITPVYLQVARVGTSFTAATSSDGSAWTALAGSTATLGNLSGTLLAGMAVTSHTSTAPTLNTATFDTVGTP